MATAAALPTPAPAIDLSAPNTFPVRLGSSVTKTASTNTYSSVRYNYKPGLKDEGDVECRLLPAKADAVRLALTSEGGREWEYNGSRAEEEERFVLVLSLGEGKREAVLERLGGAYGMEITKTPEGVVKKGTYPSLPEQGAGESDRGLFGEADDDDDESADPDPDNPFDYRHFLRAAEAKARKDRADAQQAADRRSAIGTPTLNGRAPVSAAAKSTKATPATTAAKKRKTAASAPKPNPKRVPAGRSPPRRPTPQAAAPKPAAQPFPQRAAIPEVRLDRIPSSAGFSSPTTFSNQPSTQEPHKEDEDEDSGELILENESPVTSKHPRAMGLALAGQLGGSKSGPRSLRSAASMSPASRVQSPRVEDEGAREYEFEFGGDDDEGGDGNGDEGGDEDEDVEGLELGSPAQPAQEARGGQGGGEEVAVEDDEDDMEAQLALAMAQEDEEPATRVEESEEDVSEEE